MFWPNICCKERRDKFLEACVDPKGVIKRENIIPFALSQGGDYSKHNLYVEVTESLKEHGYLHAGMNKMLDALPGVGLMAKKRVKQLVNDFFAEITLCGPRIVNAPGKRDTIKLCELFVPYKHSMTQLFELVKKLYALKEPVQNSFLQILSLIHI